MSERDETMVQWVREFNSYELYWKGAKNPNLKEIPPKYQDVIAEFIPGPIDWYMNSLACGLSASNPPIPRHGVMF
jgi:Myo-inositol oxygenase